MAERKSRRQGKGRGNRRKKTKSRIMRRVEEKTNDQVNRETRGGKITVEKYVGKKQEKEAEKEVRVMCLT